MCLCHMGSLLAHVDFTDRLWSQDVKCQPFLIIANVLSVFNLANFIQFSMIYEFNSVILFKLITSSGHFDMEDVLNNGYFLNITKMLFNFQKNMFIKNVLIKDITNTKVSCLRFNFSFNSLSTFDVVCLIFDSD